MKVGVLAFQGDVEEHLDMLEKSGTHPISVKSPGELEMIDGLILPGGESTTLELLLESSGMADAIKKRAEKGMPVWGTCMGAILLAKRLAGNPKKQATLELMDITVRRNAYGRQNESFEADVSIPILNCEDFPGVFIRAPWIEKTGPHVEVLATHLDKAIFVREKNILACTFHPEIAKDNRLHHYFINMIKQAMPTSDN